MIGRNKRCARPGHDGLLGSPVVRALETTGIGEVVCWRCSELNLRDREATMDANYQARPDVVINAAGKVGGIMANSTCPVMLLNGKVLTQTNFMDATHANAVNRLLFLGSSCTYPRQATQPMRESSRMTGPFEPTNQTYGMAEISGIYYIEAHRTECGRHWVSAMPTNLWGRRTTST